MNKFNELDEYLAVDHNLDCWSDDAVDYAIELVDSLSDVDWPHLENTWGQRPIHWQVKLTEALFGSEKSRVIDLLIQMLKSSEVEVALAAAESLASKDYVWVPDSSIRVVLEQLQDRIEDGNRITIEKLIHLIPE